MTKEVYIDMYNKYYRMNTTNLQKHVVHLYGRKFEDHDISVYAEHRVAARVLLERMRDGTGLLFHLKNIVIKSC